MAGRSTLVEILVQLKDEATHAFDKLGAGIKGVFEHATSLHGILELIGAAAIYEGIMHLVEAFAEEELAITRLNAALRVNGIYTREGSHAIQEMAEKMEALTTHSSEQAITISATLAQLTHGLSAGQLAEAQKAVIGLSDTLGIGLESATRMVGLAIDGTSNHLKRYGVEVDLAASPQDRFNQIMRKTAGFFAVSEEATKTMHGQIAQAKVQFNNLQVAIGQVLVEIIRFETKGGTIRDLLKDMTAYVRDHGNAWIQTAVVFAESWKVIGAVVAGALSAVVGLVYAFNDVLDVFVQALVDSIKWLVIGAINVAITQINQAFIEPVNEILKTFHQGTIATFGLIDNAKPFEKTKGELQELKADVYGVIHAFDDVGPAMDRLRTATLKPVGGVLALPRDAGAGNGDQLGGGETGTDKAVKALIERQKELKAQFDSGQISLRAYNDGVRKMKLEVLDFLRANVLVGTNLTNIHKLLKDLGADSGLGEALKRAFVGTADEVGKLNEEMAKFVKGGVDALTGAIADAAFAGGRFGETMEKAVGKAAAAQAKLAVGRALMETAEGVAAAFWDPPAAAAHFHAAAEFGAAAAFMASIAGATGGFNQSSSGGSSGAGAATGQAAGLGKGGPVTFVFPLSFTNSPEFLSTFAQAMQSVLGNRQVIIDAR